MPDPGAIERMSIGNLTDGTILPALFNPTEVEEQIQVFWNELDVLGMSHKPLQYKNTGNHQFSFSMRFDAMVVHERVSSSVKDFHGTEYIQAAKQYLLSLCYAPRGAQDVVTGRPTRILFFWPRFASMTSVIDSLRFRHTWFSRKGPSARFDVDVALKEIRDFRLTSEDAFANGTIRPGG